MQVCVAAPNSRAGFMVGPSAGLAALSVDRGPILPKAVFAWSDTLHQDGPYQRY